MSDREPHGPAFDADPVLVLPAGGPRGLASRWSVPMTWTGSRWATAAAAVVLAAAALVFANGAFAAASLPGALWTAALVGVGSATFGLLVGSLVGAPIGAGATACDLRGPLFGMMGLLLATTQSRSSLLVQLFAGLPLDAIRFGVQPAVGAAAVALMAAALSSRLRLERDALADPAGAQACATCVPLFPRRPQA
ncbi:hypothetical protein SA2016_4011 [Sinomonas atrocyanea]|uniref:Uncharacterized protein n=1 Tax=Sinomonas atrocyanea TaxID=37927 RepID=A0A127A7S1_9MICC|nr:hypothetical protein [Sinomonas atrocyanea]AMM34665.1 hypothetical protein SA2016_4011 [Sinomonas atrocyanea]GEB65924.1 hypothetical protein SAT01_33720 [Sinomonas atrocyanea]GGG80313.1 hypothetical protein GCM10007172_36950 [Sinomonas atrocyanea]